MSLSVISACAATARAFSSARGNCHSSASSSSRGSMRSPSSEKRKNTSAMLSSRVSVVSMAARAAPSNARKGRSLTIVADLGGQYGDTFKDVDKVLVSYFTFRALKETLAQIQETDCSPGKSEYKWLYTFASENNPNDSQKFIKALFATRQDYGQRILAQRQSLFDSWQQSFVPGSVAEIIESQNLEHLRDHLFSTVNLSDDCLALDDPDECIPPEDEPALQLRKEEDETVA